MIALFRSLVERIRMRRTRALRVVDEAPLFGGCAVHVVDVSGRRFVFASTTGAICLLAQLDEPYGADSREEGAWRCV